MKLRRGQASAEALNLQPFKLSAGGFPPCLGHAGLAMVGRESFSLPPSSETDSVHIMSLTRRLSARREPASTACRDLD